MYDFITVREFNTARFSVVLDCTFDNSEWDGDGESPSESGYDCYMFRVRVLAKGLELGSDTLHGTWCKNPSEFMDHRECAAYTRKLRSEGSDAICGSYFSDMVRAAISDARKMIREVATLQAA